MRTEIPVFGLDDDHLALSCRFVHLFPVSDIFLDINELGFPVRVGQDRIRIGIPPEQHLTLAHLLTIFDEKMGSIGYCKP